MTRCLGFCFLALQVAALGGAQETVLGSPPTVDSGRKPASESGEHGGNHAKSVLPELDMQSRGSVETFFNLVYRASEGIPMPEDASVENCDPGSSSFLYDAATLLRVNYFRRMAGWNEVVLNREWADGCREAALMMVANCSLDHTPPSSWHCYTENGYGAASRSQLTLGATGPEAVDVYMEDFCAANIAANISVGHRVAILSRDLSEMATGSVRDPGWSVCAGGQANALQTSGDTSKTMAYEDFIAWPPPGYVPTETIYRRWSLSAAGADFANATVAMTLDGAPIYAQVIFAGSAECGERVLVWEPSLPEGLGEFRDNTLTVDVSGIAGSERSECRYAVTAFRADHDPYEGTKAALAWVYPATGSDTTSTEVVLFGRNIGVEGVQVFFGGQAAPVQEYFPNAIRVLAPPQDLESVDVVVVLPGGERCVLPATFSYFAHDAVETAEHLLDNFDAADTDHSGALSWYEAARCLPGFLFEQFELLDDDMSGQVTRDELNMALRLWGCGCFTACFGSPEDYKSALGDMFLLVFSLGGLLAVRAWQP